MGSLQEHKFFAVTQSLMSSTFQRWLLSDGLLLLFSSSFKALSPENGNNFDAIFGNMKLDQNNLMWERHA